MTVRPTDLGVRLATVEFRDVVFSRPLVLSGATIDRVTLAVVSVTGENRLGGRAVGQGASMLSVPWSWPRSALTVAARDGALRELTQGLARRVVGTEPADPMQHWRALDGDLDRARAEVAGGRGLHEPMPRLAAHLALGAVDNAVHDAWARAAGRSAWSLYDGEGLADDLGAYLGPAGRGRYPAALLGPGRVRLPVQHVVGADDPVDATLASALRGDGIHHVKVKVAGQDPAVDADRVAGIHQLLAGAPGEVTVAVDPNEGYQDAHAAAAMVRHLRDRHPQALAALRYLEQPIPRGAAPEAVALRALGAMVPVLVDEELDRLDRLPALADEGWSGVVVKASKGQTAALLASSFAVLNRMPLAVQDLTAVDVALEHSARLAAQLPVSFPGFECNSRQYAPEANRDLARRRPELVAVRDGAVVVGPPFASGLD